MTEAMSRHEIEDVLTSIRRLVSHDERAPAAPAQGKLVLTSALRVDTPQPEPASPPPVTAGPIAQAADQELSDPPVASAPAMRPTLAQPAFAEAPLRPPLLTRIAQAGQLSAPAPLGPKGTETPPADSLEEAMTDSALEATLARLEKALSITSNDVGTQQAESAMDDSALSQIVARIVRQELQGELGERITRNIRKLVRAEVARELQMRNL